MAHDDPRTRDVPPELIAMVRDCVSRRGRRGASRVLGLSVTTLAAVLAGFPVMPGTLALLREAARRKEAA